MSVRLTVPLEPMRLLCSMQMRWWNINIYKNIIRPVNYLHIYICVAYLSLYYFLKVVLFLMKEMSGRRFLGDTIRRRTAPFATIGQWVYLFSGNKVWYVYFLPLFAYLTYALSPIQTFSVRRKYYSHYYNIYLI